MPHERPLGDRPAAIDGRLQRLLSADHGNDTALARATVPGDDRWYGRLLALSYDSLAGAPAGDAVLDAAVAVECLRGYCRLRSEMLVRNDDAEDHAATRESAPALLASDYLYTSAYSALAGIDSDHLAACFETLASVSERITGTFGETYLQPSPTTDRRAFVDGTAGALGRGAAVLGATLAGVDRPRRERFGTLGRGLATAREIRLVLDSSGDPVGAETFDPDRTTSADPDRTVFGPLYPTTSAAHDRAASTASDRTTSATSDRTASTAPDERRLRKHAERRFEEATRTFRDASITADTGPLRTFVESVETVRSTDGASD